jgi:hypothetical protein
VAAGRRTTPRRHRDRTAASGRDCDRVPSWCDEKNQWVFDVAERVVAEPVAGLMTNAHFKRQTRAVERSRTDGVEHDDEYPRAASNCSGSAARGDQENYCEPEKGNSRHAPDDIGAPRTFCPIDPHHSVGGPTLFLPTPHLMGGYDPARAAADGDTGHLRNLVVLKSDEPRLVAAHPCPLGDRGVAGVAIEQRLVSTVITADDNLPGALQRRSLPDARVGRPKPRLKGIDPEDRARGRRCGSLFRTRRAVPAKGINGKACNGDGYNDRERSQSLQR